MIAFKIGSGFFGKIGHGQRQFLDSSRHIPLSTQHRHSPNHPARGYEQILSDYPTHLVKIGRLGN